MSILRRQDTAPVVWLVGEALWGGAVGLGAPSRWPLSVGAGCRDGDVRVGSSWGSPRAGTAPRMAAPSPQAGGWDAPCLLRGCVGPGRL